MSAFRLSIRNLPGNRNLPAEGSSPRKEDSPISIFGSAIDKKKNYGRGGGTAILGISRRLAECQPSVKYVPPKE